MQIRKIFRAEIAHRVRDAYTTRCRGLHGHSYVFEIFLSGVDQDEAEMLVDFKLLKEKVGKFLDAFDHSILIEYSDTFLVENASNLNPRYIIVPYNPTAESMASHIFQHIESHFPELGISRVIVHETSTGCAIADRVDPGRRIALDSVVFSPEVL